MRVDRKPCRWRGRNVTGTCLAIITRAIEAKNPRRAACEDAIRSAGLSRQNLWRGTTNLAGVRDVKQDTKTPGA